MSRAVNHTPIVRTMQSGDVGKCGCFPCCRCLHLSFLLSTSGILKIVQMILGGVCESMLVNFGMSQAPILGMSFLSLLTTNSACVSTVSLLMFCYVFSEKSYNLIRSSLLETLFNASAAVSYLSASSYLAIAVNLYLYPMYLIKIAFIGYPAMIAAYMMGFALSLMHGLDAYYAYRYYKGYR